MSRRLPSMHPIAATLGGGLALLLVSGCADLQDRMQDVMGDMGGEPETVALRCDDDRRLRVTFYDNAREARVETEDETYRLELVNRSRDRRVYEGEDDTRLTVEVGEEAHFRIADQPDYSNCEQRRR